MIPTVDSFCIPTAAHIRITLMVITAFFTVPAFGLSPTRSIDQYVHTSWGQADGLPEGPILSILETENGYLWMSTQSSLVRFDGYRFTVFKDGTFGFPQFGFIRDQIANANQNRPAADDDERITHFTEDDGLSSDDVTALLEDKDKNLWIGTLDGMLHRLRDGVVERSAVNSVPDNGGIFALTEDRTGALWVGTGRGLERYKDGVFTTFSQREGLAEARILNVEPRRAGGLYVLDGAGAIYIHEDGRAGIVAEEGSISEKGMSDLLETPDGSLWIGGSSLYRFKNGHLESFFSPGGNISVIVPDGDGLLTAQTDEDGISSLFHYSQGNFTRLYKNLSFRPIGQIIRDSKKRLWITQQGAGILRIDGQTQRFFTTKDGLPHNDVYDVLEAGNETFWVSTRSGLARIRQDRVSSLAHITNAPSHSPRHLVLDNTTHLFITADDGIYRIPTADLEKAADGAVQQVNTELFTTDDGLGSIAISQQPSAQAKTKDGNIWVATTRGLSMISPRRNPVERPAPKVIIEALIPDAPHLNFQDRVFVSKGREHMEIRFAAPTLKNEKQTRFRYRLKGLEETWVSDTGKRAAAYSDPPPGEYIFEAAVRCRNGAFGEAAVLHLTIVPRWFETLWAKLLFAVATTLLLAAAYRQRVKQRKCRKEV